jgi:hypothetical protein
LVPGVGLGDLPDFEAEVIDEAFELGVPGMQ